MTHSVMIHALCTGRAWAVRNSRDELLELRDGSPYVKPLGGWRGNLRGIFGTGSLLAGLAPSLREVRCALPSTFHACASAFECWCMGPTRLYCN